MSDIQSEMIEISGDEVNFQAYLARPVDSKPHAAVIVIHEIFGLVDHTKNVTDRFARQGYVALAPHLYSRPDMVDVMLPDNIQTAMQFSRGLGPEKLGDLAAVQQEMAILPQDTRETVQKLFPYMFGPGSQESRNYYIGELLKSVDFLKEQSYVRSGKVASVGFCFGGGMSINLACHTDLAACVVFYGQNPSPIDLVKNIPCPVLGLYGAEDMRINQDLDKLVKAMTEYKKDLEMRIYPGAGHAFFNDTNKMTYREAAAREAWERVLNFYHRALSD
jgi:carboxymethylenebutenolidase